MTNGEPQTHSAPQQPNEIEIRAELARILGSRVFEQAGRATEFLRFVVEETLGGRASRLKGYTIAIEVFERPATFDAQSDPLVRVEAGRLRRRLMEYYHGEGHDNRVRIELPRGGYAPAFAYAPAQATASAKSTRRRHRRWFVSVAVVGVVFIVALLGWNVADRGLPPNGTGAAPRSGLTAGPGPRLLVLPVTNLSGNTNLDAFAAGLTEETILALVGVSIFATASPGTNAESASLQELRAQYDVGYVLTGSIRTEGDRARVAIRVVDADFGTQLWTTTFDEGLNGTSGLAAQERIARSIAGLVSSPYGPVYAHEIALSAGKPAEDLDPYECLLRFYAYAGTFDAAGHAQSVRCMQRTVLSEPRFAEAWSALAVLYLHEHTFGYSPQPDRGAALERALEAVRTSLDIDGGGRVAALALAGIRLASNDSEGFGRAVERALAITPSHPAVLAQIGFLLVLAGDWERGLPLLEEAIPATASVPGWYYTAHAFRYLQTDEYEQALEWALKIDAPNWFVTPLTVAAAAALAGRADIAEREVARLLELYPDFAATGAERLRGWGLNGKVLTTLLEGMRLAGL
jgi:TolB-like protein